MLSITGSSSLSRLVAGDISLEPLTKIQCCLVQGLFGGGCPQVQVVSRSPALEATKGILGQIDREYAAGFFRTMKRTGAAELIPPGRAGLKPKEFQNFRHRDERTNLAEVDARHGCSSNREEEPVGKTHSGILRLPGNKTRINRMSLILGIAAGIA